MTDSPLLVGIVNVTSDSFSDGGRYLAPDAALAHARQLVADGAHVVELGPASSNPDAMPVEPAEEIRRLEPLLAPLVAEGVAVSIDSWRPETQRWAAAHGAAYLNDIQGFPDEGVYGALAAARCRLVVMHSVQRVGPATRTSTDAEAVVRGAYAFFAERLPRLEAAGIGRDRLIIDPGMGFFLGSDPAPSVRMLRELPHLRKTLGLPAMLSVSRKSFLGVLSGRPIGARGAATLAAELYAARRGVEYLRTHDVAALSDALAVQAALTS